MRQEPLQRLYQVQRTRATDRNVLADGQLTAGERDRARDGKIDRVAIIGRRDRIRTGNPRPDNRSVGRAIRGGCTVIVFAPAAPAMSKLMSTTRQPLTPRWRNW